MEQQNKSQLTIIQKIELLARLEGMVGYLKEDLKKHISK